MSWPLPGNARRLEPRTPQRLPVNNCYWVWKHCKILFSSILLSQHDGIPLLGLIMNYSRAVTNVCVPLSVNHLHFDFSAAENWYFEEGMFHPKPDTSRAFEAFIAQLPDDDDTFIAFSFLYAGESQVVKIRKAVLQRVNGPLEAFTRPPWNTSSPIERMSESQRAFREILQFLNCQAFPFEGGEWENNIQILKEAHFWDVSGLIQLVCSHIVVSDAIPNSEACRAFMPFMRMSVFPAPFKEYILETCGKMFNGIYELTLEDALRSRNLHCGQAIALTRRVLSSITDEMVLFSLRMGRSIQFVQEAAAALPASKYVLLRSILEFCSPFVHDDTAMLRLIQATNVYGLSELTTSLRLRCFLGRSRRYRNLVQYACAVLDPFYNGHKLFFFHVRSLSPAKEKTVFFYNYFQSCTTRRNCMGRARLTGLSSVKFTVQCEAETGTGLLSFSIIAEHVPLPDCCPEKCSTKSKVHFSLQHRPFFCRCEADINNCSYCAGQWHDTIADGTLENGDSASINYLHNFRCRRGLVINTTMDPLNLFGGPEETSGIGMCLRVYHRV